MRSVSFEDVQAALNLPEFDFASAQLRMAPNPRGVGTSSPDNPPRKAGVLVLIYPESEGLFLILTRRTERLRGHSGQISFPGGSYDPQDASLTATALRETCEELGICDQPLTIVGMLNTVYIPPTHFDVYPTVATLPFRPVMSPNPEEVAEVLALSLDSLLDEGIKQEEERQFQNFRVKVPFYMVREHKVWGATAVMLSELEQRLRTAMND
jgi:8-oxo-dGTP pyrophosphatase MutT (NUDIX family)